MFGASISRVYCVSRSCWSVVLAFAVVFVTAGLAAQISPKLLPFQGYLADPSGEPVPDGSYAVQFQMFDSPIAGNVVWSGEVHRVSANDGLINVILGSKTSLGSAGLDFSRTTYLELTVDANGDGVITVADPPLLPRQIILPALFAHDAGALAGYRWRDLFADQADDPGKGLISGQRIVPETIDRTHFSRSIAEELSGLVDGLRGLQSLLEDAVSVPRLGRPGERPLKLYSRVETFADRNTVLLIHSDDAGGSSEFVDSSPFGHAITVEGGVNHSTAHPQFGRSALEFNEDLLSLLRVASSSAFNFGTGDFTIDFWARRPQLSGDDFAFVLNPLESTHFSIDLFLNQIQVIHHGIHETRWSAFTAPNVWHHFAVVRWEDRIFVYRNGESVADFDVAGLAFSDGGHGPVIGGRPDMRTSHPQHYLTGQLDEFRVSKGVARWRGNFVVPTEPYPSEEGARLYFVDESGVEYRVQARRVNN